MSEPKLPPGAEDLLSQAAVLSEALPYMRRHAGETLVVKYGGHAMGDAETARLFARDVVLLRQTGANPVVVHGGGPQIGDMLKRLNVESTFVDGLRVTDAETAEIVEMVLCGSINKWIVAEIQAAGGRAVGLSGKDGGLIKAKRLQRTQRDPDSNIERILDLGLVGEPDKIDTHVLDFFKGSDVTPVIAPIGLGEDGETLNINSDTAAGAVAAALGASRLLMLTDVTGVLDADKNLIEDMTAADARGLIKSGVASGGMIPKLETCIKAVESGVGGAVVLDGRIAHALLVELFTPHGAGTLIKPA
ncbi:MAG: acetylglutamate kinase [Rhodospirillales bacterium]